MAPGPNELPRLGRALQSLSDVELAQMGLRRLAPDEVPSIEEHIYAVRTARATQAPPAATRPRLSLVADPSP